MPDELAEWVGLEVPEYNCLRDTIVRVLWDGIVYKSEKWSDIPHIKGVQPLAFYDSEFYADTPAITVNKYGKGKAYYVATNPVWSLPQR